MRTCWCLPNWASKASRRSCCSRVEGWLGVWSVRLQAVCSRALSACWQRRAPKYRENSTGGRLSHVGVQVDAQDLERIRTVAPTMGCQVVQDGPTPLVFDDPYGVRWEMTTISYEDPRHLSTGVRTG